MIYFNGQKVAVSCLFILQCVLYTYLFLHWTLFYFIFGMVLFSLYSLIKGWGRIAIYGKSLLYSYLLSLVVGGGYLFLFS
jgi:uncharacterized membrane protein